MDGTPSKLASLVHEMTDKRIQPGLKVPVQPIQLVAIKADTTRNL
jgi:hypothetical protein